MNYCSCSKLTKLYKIVDKRKFADYNEIVVRTKGVPSEFGAPVFLLYFIKTNS